MSELGRGIQSIGMKYLHMKKRDLQPDTWEKENFGMYLKFFFFFRSRKKEIFNVFELFSGFPTPIL